MRNLDQHIEATGDIDGQVHAGDLEAGGKACGARLVAQGDQRHRGVDRLGIVAERRVVEAGVQFGASRQQAAHREIAGDEAGEGGDIDHRGATLDPHIQQAILRVIGEAGLERRGADRLEADHAGCARRRRPEQGALGEEAGVLEHVADGDDGVVDRNLGPQHRRREGSGTGENREQGREDELAHLWSPDQRN